MDDFLKLLLIIFEDKSGKDLESIKREMKENRDLVCKVIHFEYECIDFITLKKIKGFLSKYPDEDYFSKVNKSWHSIYLWIKSVL